MTDLSWRSAGNCVGMDPAIFYPVRGVDVAPAKAVCVECPVRDECLDHGIRHEAIGIWGGSSERERRRVRRQRGLIKETVTIPGFLARSGCGTDAGYKAHRRAGQVACNACRSAHAAYVRVGKTGRVSA